MKGFIKNISKALALVIISSIIGMILLDLVYLIPTDRTEYNASKAMSLFVNENYLTANSLRYSVQSVTDPYSDSLMLSNCFIRREGEPFYVSALKSTYIEVAGATDLGYPFLGFIRYFAGNSDWTLLDYSRYWNGYQVPLILLLQVFSYPQLRIG
ncbi:MAG: hypothetical protein IJR45_07980, partial [Firmicutes bacterium]|nr:hypothetical protein [Bacillota bacterium]